MDCERQSEGCESAGEGPWRQEYDRFGVQLKSSVIGARVRRRRPRAPLAFFDRASSMTKLNPVNPFNTDLMKVAAAYYLAMAGGIGRVTFPVAAHPAPRSDVVINAGL